MLKQETWQQDPCEPELWLGENGVLINTAALEARTYYFEVLKLPTRPVGEFEPGSRLEPASC